MRVPFPCHCHQVVIQATRSGSMQMVLVPFSLREAKHKHLIFLLGILRRVPAASGVVCSRTKVKFEQTVHMDFNKGTLRTIRYFTKGTRVREELGGREGGLSDSPATLVPVSPSFPCWVQNKRRATLRSRNSAKHIRDITLFETLPFSYLIYIKNGKSEGTPHSRPPAASSQIFTCHLTHSLTGEPSLLDCKKNSGTATSRKLGKGLE
ncbi:hypothetical protein BDZ97DRAFT_1024028 [Flammula alnicola]|nr:hypothetical protein BDZ97DRAFT_1024028 [Flammula alnicola]